MPEYIARAALMGKLTTKEVQSAMREMDGSQAYSFFLALINNEPAADVVAVVRCKDCKCRVEVFKPEIENGGGICMKMYDTGKIEGYLCRVKADDFCSYGERRADDG